MFNTLQVVLALIGLAGIGFFLAERTFVRVRKTKYSPSPRVQGALFLGLAAWVALSMIRHDVVAAVGLIIAALLLYRHYRSLGQGRE